MKLRYCPVKYCSIMYIGGRSNQEDAILIPEGVIQEERYVKYGIGKNPIEVFAVCDGMGGHKYGERASRWVAEKLKELKNLKNINEREIYLKIKKIQKECEKDETYPSDSGSTVAGVLITGEGKYYVFNAGDSRVYAIEEGEIKLISKDHSFVFELYEQGEIDEKIMRNHPLRSVIYSGIGTAFKEKWEKKEKKMVNVFEREFKDDTILLICSDGLSDELFDKEIKDVLEYDGIEATEKLLEKVLGKKKGYKQDNISIITIEKEDRKKKSKGLLGLIKEFFKEV